MQSENTFDLAPLMAELTALCRIAAGQAQIPAVMLEMAEGLFSDPRLGGSFPGAEPIEQARQYRDVVAATPRHMLEQALDAAGPAMRWTQNPNYRGVPDFVRYLETSTYCVISGKGGLIDSDDVWTGFLMMGPDTYYPAHDHPAAEGYIMLSGTGEWWREGEEWTERPPLTSVYHAPHRSHAMRTTSRPLLALYIATGDISVLPKPSKT